MPVIQCPSRIRKLLDPDYNLWQASLAYDPPEAGSHLALRFTDKSFKRSKVRHVGGARQQRCKAWRNVIRIKRPR